MLQPETERMIDWHKENSAGTAPEELHRQMLVTLGALASELGKAKPKADLLRSKLAVIAGGAMILEPNCCFLTDSDRRLTCRDSKALQCLSDALGRIGFSLQLNGQVVPVDARDLQMYAVAWLERLGG